VEAAGVKSSGSSLNDVSAQQTAQVIELKSRQDAVTTGGQAGDSAQGRPLHPGIAERAMAVDPAFWRNLREDFEKLQAAERLHGHRFRLIVNLGPLKDKGETRNAIEYGWDFPDPGLKTRLSALALRGACGLGYDSEYHWYDELSRAAFVRFDVAGTEAVVLSEGAMAETKWGRIADVVEESITLCYKLEADAGSPDRAGPARSSQSGASPTGNSDSQAGPVGTDSTAERRGEDRARLAAYPLVRDNPSTPNHVSYDVVEEANRESESPSDALTSDGEPSFATHLKETQKRRDPSLREMGKSVTKRGKARSKWLDSRRAAMGWTSDLDIHVNSGPTYNTIRRYRSGAKSTRDPYVRQKLAAAFGCKISEVPN
jgi:hypothetical protein